MNQELPSYLTIEKAVGETPLVALERLRTRANISKDIPLAYAGRLDPMASGKLLILVGDTCKVQEQYHNLDKEYEFEILLDVHSDTSDVLGIISSNRKMEALDEDTIREIVHSLRGDITLPYPHYSSKTVRGKPLHTWTLEGRLSEIEIPTKKSTIHKLTYLGSKTLTASELYRTVKEKIETIPPVTDERKALGADFRRVDVRAGWKSLYESNPHTDFHLLRFRCIASSGTYMRSLAEVIGEKLGTKALTYSIHRTKIGRYFPIFGSFGFWTKIY